MGLLCLQISSNSGEIRYDKRFDRCSNCSIYCEKKAVLGFVVYFNHMHHVLARMFDLQSFSTVGLVLIDSLLLSLALFFFSFLQIFFFYYFIHSRRHCLSLPCFR